MSARRRRARPFVPPRHVIDLSLPPRSRYKALAAQYKSEVKALTGLFDQLLLDLALPPSWLPMVNKCSKLLLRKVHDSEQAQELRGIADETAVPMYLLVAFNVVLDLLMGCTSGAALSWEPGQSQPESKMLHFRTLDWTMDPLRKVVVQLDFIRSQSKDPTKVLASSITYVGFTGVLTGVKEGLSMSLNFRAVHNAKTKIAHFRYYFHHLLVLLGRRPSIACLLRRHLVDEVSMTKPTSDIATVTADIKSRHTTAAYIILSDGVTTVTLEKDYATAKVRQSSTFIAITNHDKEDHIETKLPNTAIDAGKGAEMRKSTGLQDIIDESTDRLNCIESKWNARVARARLNAESRDLRPTSTWSTRSTQSATESVSVTSTELVKWLCEWPTTNECTHFAAVLDPSIGKVAWSRAYPEPLQGPHTSR